MTDRNQKNNSYTSSMMGMQNSLHLSMLSYRRRLPKATIHLPPIDHHYAHISTDNLTSEHHFDQKLVQAALIE